MGFGYETKIRMDIRRGIEGQELITEKNTRTRSITIVGV